MHPCQAIALSAHCNAKGGGTLEVAPPVCKVAARHPGGGRPLAISGQGTLERCQGVPDGGTQDQAEAPRQVVPLGRV
ncbi:MAG TPA: hypothetical protein VFF52_28675 [Isosphaeraceae bacterium]|nr:hypothetical protein [Isosphaeraceae bacterium]